MIRSMTAFAAATGQHGVHSWSWELRSVNAKGLDMRLRVPDWIDGLEAALRGQLAKGVSRGNVSLSLRVQREDAEGTLAVQPAVLDSVLDALAEVERVADAKGLTFAPSKAADILALRGVLEAAGGDDDSAALSKALLAEFPALVKAFLDMRAAEGKALHAVLSDQLTQVDGMVKEATKVAETRRAEMAESFRAALARVVDNSDGVDPQRIEQEIAMIAVKADVTEEIDRLSAHVAAARELLGEDAPVGRKFDFLMQEFNREANTLCSKSQSQDLTRVGLALKAVIDQMREQVQNVE